MKNSKDKPSFKDYLLWTLKYYGCSWLAWAISMIPLYIFRGIYHYNETRPFWESVIISVVGIIIGTVAVYILAIKTDEFEKADPRYVKKIAIGSGIIYTVICAFSLGSFPICVISYHLSIVLLNLFGGFLALLIIPLAAAIVNAFFAFAVIKAAKKARIRRESFKKELMGEKYSENDNKN